MLNKQAEATVQAIKQSGSIGQKEFTRILKESKSLERNIRKEHNRISKNEIVKNRLVYLYVSGMYSIKQIASILCVSPGTVRNILKDEEVLNKINDYLAEEKSLVEGRIKTLSIKAIETVNELMDSDDDSVRLNASKDVLDRAGHKPSDKQEVNVNVSYEQQMNQLLEGVDYTFTDDATCGDNKNLLNGVINSDNNNLIETSQDVEYGGEE